jgi:hypothetical protein
LLFDRSAETYLPGLLGELAWLTVWRLRHILDPNERWGYHRLGPDGICRQERSCAGSDV